MDSSTENVFLLASFVFEALLALKIVQLVTSTLTRRHIMAAVTCCAFRWVAAVTAAFTAAPRAEKVVEDAAASLRVKMSHSFLHAYAFLSLFWVISIQHNMIHGRARWMSPAFTWTLLLVFVCLTFYVLRPSTLKASTLNYFYVAGMAVAASLISPWHTSIDNLLLINMVLCVFLRMPAVLLCTQMSLAVLCNGAFSALLIARTSELTNEGLQSAYVFVWWEASCCAATVAFSVVSRSHLTRRAELKIRGTNAEMQFNAASTLLSFMCDAVVELDQELCLTEHSKGLAALLLKSSSNAGARLLDFMPAQDAEFAEGHLRNFRSSSQMAHAFHTRLMDSCSTKLATEVFQVKYYKADGQQGHMVGLREFADGFPRNEHDEPLELDEEKEEFLEIDLCEMKVTAASSDCVGMFAKQLFATPTFQLIQRLYAEAKLQDSQGHSLNKKYSFVEMPVRLGQAEEPRSGCMQIRKVSPDAFCMLVRFLPIEVSLPDTCLDVGDERSRPQSSHSVCSL